jgi:phage terminase small subunit
VPLPVPQQSACSSAEKKKKQTLKYSQYYSEKSQRKHLKEHCFKNKSDLDNLACYCQDYKIYIAAHFAKFTGETEN